MTCPTGCIVPPDLHEMEDLGGASLYVRRSGDLFWVAEFAGEDAAQLFLRLPAAFHALAGLVEACYQDDFRPNGGTGVICIVCACSPGQHVAGCHLGKALAAAQEALKP